MQKHKARTFLISVIIYSLVYVFSSFQTLDRFLSAQKFKRVVLLFHGFFSSFWVRYVSNRNCLYFFATELSRLLNCMLKNVKGVVVTCILEYNIKSCRNTRHVNFILAISIVISPTLCVHVHNFMRLIYISLYFRKPCLHLLTRILSKFSV